MLKENEFMITDHKSFKTKLSFEVYTTDENFEYDFEVSCAEDIQEIMRLYFQKDWKTMFHEWNQNYHGWWRDVCDVNFEGIYIVAKEEDKGFVYLRLDNTQKVNVAVNLETMGDKNAAKINEIRSILNK